MLGVILAIFFFNVTIKKWQHRKILKQNLKIEKNVDTTFTLLSVAVLVM